jgi:hypothetical protein
VPVTCSTSIGIDHWCRRHIGVERHQRRAQVGRRQRLGHRIRRRLHQRTVEGRGDRQQYATLDAVLLDQRHRAIDRVLMTGNHDLRGIIVIGDGANLALGSQLDKGARLFKVRAKQRRHRAHANRHGRLHRLAAQLQQPGGGGQA